MQRPAWSDGAGVDVAAMACGWAYDLAEGRVPPSWAIARGLMARGAAGLLAPAFATGATGTRPGMHNLVLWRWGAEKPHRVAVFDPAGRLPRDPSSWAPVA